MSHSAEMLLAAGFLFFLGCLLILEILAWLFGSDQKEGFDEEAARREAEEILADAENNLANRRRVRAGKCAGDLS